MNADLIFAVGMIDPEYVKLHGCIAVAKGTEGALRILGNHDFGDHAEKPLWLGTSVVS